ncbi:MAG TPA: O-antigen ligase family protein [Candidatus Paceibacterota bacterium]|nr:O-antigen ligase family protein [Candidatus Paceibacterota bacterium]
MEKSLPSYIKIILFFAALTPLIYMPSLIFPFIMGKIVFFRVVVEIALILFTWYAFLRFKEPASAAGFPRHPLILFTALFAVSVALSTVFAVDGYRAFWGDIERGGGLFEILHLLAFIALSIRFFGPKDWLRFFKLSVVVGAIVSLYGWLQFLGVTLFPFSLPVSSQPGSFLGNPAYLSSYLILLIAISLIVAFKAEEQSWRQGVWPVTVFFFVTIFITQIRGAILSAAIAAVFLLLFILFARLPEGVRSGTVKKVSVTALLIIIFGAVLFWTTRTSPLWQSIPGVKRFARESYDIASVSTRLIALGVSWDAFKEKPVLGWGPENYNIAYNKHYDPAYSFYAEDWFDRAHNKIAEVAVMQGIIGLLAYLTLFVSVFYFLFKHFKGSFWLKPTLAAALVGYFVQNLFLFDTPVSYLLFFTLIGYLAAETGAFGSRFPYPRLSGGLLQGARILLAAAVFIIALASLYFGNFIPFRQSREYIKAVRTKVGERIFLASNNFLYPYSFAQATIRAQLSDLVYNNGLFRNREFRALTDKVISSLEELVAREPYEPRNFIRLVEDYSEYAKDDRSYFSKAEEYSRKAFDLSPKRQGVRYHLAFVLSGEGKYDEALALAEETVALKPDVYKSQYQLGIVYSLYADAPNNIGTPLQEEYRRKAREQFTRAWAMAREQNRYTFFLVQDFNNLISIYRILRDNVGAAEVVEVAIRNFPGEKKFYIDAIAIYRDLRRKEDMIAVARRMSDLFPETKNDVETIVDLAEKEKWEILDTL